MSGGIDRNVGFSPSRLVAIAVKESLQVVRDPSNVIIAFVLPIVLLFLFAFAISLDVRGVAVGVVVESDGAPARELAAAFAATRYFETRFAHDRRELEPLLVAGELRGIVVIPQDFAARLRANLHTDVQVVTDGSSPNTASFVANYARGVVASWLASARAEALREPSPPRVVVEPRFWYNADLESRAFIAPGAIAIVMTMIGTMLTALVLAREWERGTMEAMMATPLGIGEFLIGKLLPYFCLGLGATLICAIAAQAWLGVPLQGSVAALLALSTAFLMPALGLGLLISAATKNQFVASQLALFSGFLPAFLLSGFLFEIDSMPEPIQWLTRVVAARYFVAGLQTLFLTGDVWAALVRSIGPMLALGAVFFTLAALNTRKRLE